MFRIVVADDEKIARDKLCRSIEKFPEVTVVAAMCNGQQVKEYLELHQADVVITDIKMPVMDGLELAAWIYQNRIECQVVLVSGYEDFAYAQQAIAMGVKSYLVKPVRSEDILKVIEKQKQEHYERERQKLYVRNMQTEKKEQQLKCWIEAQQENKAEVNIRIQGGFYVFEDNREYAEDRELLEIALKNIIRWVAPSCTPIFLGKKGWHYQFAVLYEYEECAPEVEELDKKTERYLGHVFKACQAGCFDQIEELQLLLKGKISREDRVISQIESYIADHMHEAVSRDEAAAFVYMDPSYFSKYFKKKTGVSFQDYVQQMRIEESKKLLAKGLQVQEVCQKVGYQDRNYFGQWFRKNTGFSPGEYQRNL